VRRAISGRLRRLGLRSVVALEPHKRRRERWNCVAGQPWMEFCVIGYTLLDAFSVVPLALAARTSHLFDGLSGGQGLVLHNVANSLGEATRGAENEAVVDEFVLFLEVSEGGAIRVKVGRGDLSRLRVPSRESRVSSLESMGSLESRVSSLESAGMKTVIKAEFSRLSF
jgi:hypothetical protein